MLSGGGIAFYCNWLGNAGDKKSGPRRKFENKMDRKERRMGKNRLVFGFKI